MELFLTLLLLLQGIPEQAAKTGTISGTLKDSAGQPLAGVRVVAVPRPESFDSVNVAAEMFSLIETDKAGRYTLENIPPGKYYVAAGRVDFQTYYPGTQAMVEATAISVEAGGSVSKIDFTMRDSSAGRAQTLDGLISQFTIPLIVTVDGNAKVPVFSNGKLATLKLTPEPKQGFAQAATQSNFGAPVVSTPLFQFSLAIPYPTAFDFKVEVEGLPAGYSVKSMKYGSTYLNGGLLSLASTPAPTAANPVNIVTVATIVGGLVLSTQAAPRPIPQTLTIELAFAPHPRSGARVSGKLQAGDPRGVYLSGRSATVYMDGTYEFVDVPPGRYVVAAPPRRTGETTLGAVIDVGTRDVTAELHETEVPPLDIRTLTLSAVSTSSATLANLKGRVIDSETGDVVSHGKVFLIGDSWSEFNLGPEGTFEYSRLLPGRYEVEVQGVGYTTFRRSLTIADQDLAVELKTN